MQGIEGIAVANSDDRHWRDYTDSDFGLHEYHSCTDNFLDVVTSPIAAKAD